MLITLEGIEGAGKSSQVEAAARFIRAAGRPCTTTREPGATDPGRRIRRILLDPACTGMDPRAELLLYIADRVEHFEQVIRPALTRGQVVICDRYVDATLAYQGAARGVDADLIERLHALVLGDWRPALTVLIDLPVEVGLARAWNAVDRGERSSNETRFEREDRDFHQRVRQGYLDLAAREPRRFCVIDGNRPAGAVARDLQAVIAGRLHIPCPDGGGDR
jgi:dTMP kinase